MAARGILSGTGSALVQLLKDHQRTCPGRPVIHASRIQKPIPTPAKAGDASARSGTMEYDHA
jgi:hypothetical protein